MCLRGVFVVLGRLAGVLSYLGRVLGVVIDFAMEAIARYFFGAKGLLAVFSNTPRTCRCEFRGLLRMCMCMHVCMHTYVYICKCMYMNIDVCGCM